MDPFLKIRVDTCYESQTDLCIMDIEIAEHYYLRWCVV